MQEAKASLDLMQPAPAAGKDEEALGRKLRLALGRCETYSAAIQALRPATGCAAACLAGRAVGTRCMPSPCDVMSTTAWRPSC